MICRRWQTVVVPFPFMERPASKRRPALVLSNSAHNETGNHSIVAMITTAKWERWVSDHSILDLPKAGLLHPCVVRMKLFTLPNLLIERILGELGDEDREALTVKVRTMLLRD